MGFDLVVAHGSFWDELRILPRGPRNRFVRHRSVGFLARCFGEFASCLLSRDGSWGWGAQHLDWVPVLRILTKALKTGIWSRSTKAGTASGQPNRLAVHPRVGSS